MFLFQYRELNSVASVDLAHVQNMFQFMFLTKIIGLTEDCIQLLSAGKNEQLTADIFIKGLYK